MRTLTRSKALFIAIHENGYHSKTHFNFRKVIKSTSVLHVFLPFQQAPGLWTFNLLNLKRFLLNIHNPRDKDHLVSPIYYHIVYFLIVDLLSLEASKNPNWWSWQIYSIGKSFRTVLNSCLASCTSGRRQISISYHWNTQVVNALWPLHLSWPWSFRNPVRWWEEVSVSTIMVASSRCLAHAPSEGAFPCHVKSTLAYLPFHGSQRSGSGLNQSSKAPSRRFGHVSAKFIYLPRGTNTKHHKSAPCLAGKGIPFGSAPSWGCCATNFMGVVWIEFHSWAAVAWPSRLCWFGLLECLAVSRAANEDFEMLPHQLI